MNDVEIKIKKNIEHIKSKVSQALKKTNRGEDDVKIILVTKTVDCEKIRFALEDNLLDLGENRIQELLQKYDIIKDACNWHLIGHLQTNKVKYIIDKVCMIQSVDSLALTKEIQRQSEKIGVQTKILVQANVSGEFSKFGVPPGELKNLLREIRNFDNIKVEGLMTIAPFVDDVEAIRNVFKETRKIFIDIKQENIDNIDMKYLSMGMSGDFELAIEEGSNMIRIGTAIFGNR